MPGTVPLRSVALVPCLVKDVSSGGYPMAAPPAPSRGRGTKGARPSSVRTWGAPPRPRARNRAPRNGRRHPFATRRPPRRDRGHRAAGGPSIRATPPRQSHADGLVARGLPQLLVDVCQVALDGRLKEVQRGRDPGVGEAAGGHLEDLEFPVRERLACPRTHAPTSRLVPCARGPCTSGAAFLPLSGHIGPLFTQRRRAGVLGKSDSVS